MANSLKIWAGRSTAPCNVHHRVIGRVVGGMMDEIWARYQQVPPINLLVVNQVTDVPGYNAGYYADTWFNKKEGWYDGASTANREAAIVQLWKDARSFQGWDTISGIYASDISMESHWKKESGGNELDGKVRRQNGGGPAESQEHRNLKYFIAANPDLCGAPQANSRGVVEYRFRSGDEADVRFSGRHAVRVIEVKSRISNEKDMVRGIYQCIKYQCLAVAEECVDGTSRDVSTALVVERLKLPTTITSLAKTLNVELLRIDYQKVEEWAEENKDWLDGLTDSPVFL